MSSHYFLPRTALGLIEREMKTPSGFQPRGYGLFVTEEAVQPIHRSYASMVDIVIQDMQLRGLEKRI